VINEGFAQMGSDCSDANKFAEHRKAVDKRANVTANYPADLNRKILRKPLNSWDYCKNSRTIQRRKQKQENIVLAFSSNSTIPTQSKKRFNRSLPLAIGQSWRAAIRWNQLYRCDRIGIGRGNHSPTPRLKAGNIF